MRPRPLDYHLARVTYVAYLPPGDGRGQARVGFDPGLAWTLRTATPEAASDVSYLIDARIRSARRARDRVIGYDLCVASVPPFVPGCTGCMCNGRPQRTATGTAIRAMGKNGASMTRGVPRALV